jgi:hypothetical protein
MCCLDERQTLIAPQTIFNLFVSRTLASLLVRFLKDALIAKKIVEAGAAVWVRSRFTGSRVQ